MSAPAVKPALPTPGAQAPKVGSSAPPSATTNSPPASATGGPKILPNTTGSPIRPMIPPNVNHAPVGAVPLSLVQEHKSGSTPNQQQPPLLPRTPEKSKEHPLVQALGPKPTSNGVEGSPTRAPPTTAPSLAESKKPEEGVMASALVLNHATEVASGGVAQPPTASQGAIPQLTAPTPVAQPSLGKAEQPVPSAATTNHAAPISSGPQPELLGDKGKAIVVVEPPQLQPVPAVIQAVPELQAKPVVAPLEIPKPRVEPAPKPEFKVATPPRNSKRKRDIKPVQEPILPSGVHDDRKSKRVRTRTQPYQSPLPELTYIAKLTTPMKSPDDKLIVFYKNEFLAVRNAEGSFYVCQAMQNIYKSSPRIRIRWLSQEKKDNKPSDVYIPDFYDATDFDCILTNLELKKLDKNKYQLPAEERDRTQNILKRALDVEKGVSEKPAPTDDHPDGLDLSLFCDESQLKKRRNSKKAAKRKKGKGKENDSESEESNEESEEDSEDESEEDVKKKRTRTTPKKVEKPKAIVAKEKAKTKEVEKRAERASERERGREATAKRRSESLTTARNSLVKQAAVKQTVARQALSKPSPEKKGKVTLAKPTRKAEPVMENALSTRSTKTRSGKAPVIQPKSSPVTRTKDREQRRGAVTTKGRKKTGKKA